MPIELYGEQHKAPPDAVVHFAGVDPTAGPMLRYAVRRSAMGKAA